MVQMVLEDGSTVVIPMEYVEQNQVMKAEEEEEEEEVVKGEFLMEKPVVLDESYLQMTVMEEEAIKVFVMDS